jgi:hypothetical protein
MNQKWEMELKDVQQKLKERRISNWELARALTAVYENKDFYVWCERAGKDPIEYLDSWGVEDELLVSSLTLISAFKEFPLQSDWQGKSLLEMARLKLKAQVDDRKTPEPLKPVRPQLAKVEPIDKPVNVRPSMGSLMKVPEDWGKARADVRNTPSYKDSLAGEVKVADNLEDQLKAANEKIIRLERENARLKQESESLQKRYAAAKAKLAKLQVVYK